MNSEQFFGASFDWQDPETGLELEIRSQEETVCRAEWLDERGKHAGIFELEVFEAINHFHIKHVNLGAYWNQGIGTRFMPHLEERAWEAGADGGIATAFGGAITLLEVKRGWSRIEEGSPLWEFGTHRIEAPSK